MIALLNVFFRDIPSIVFEPVAVCGWLGLIAALILYRKERSVFYLTVIFSLAFMILWRMAIQIVSSRYAEILIFPMSIAAAFFIFQLENLRKILPQLPEKYVRVLPGCALAVLTLVCIGKDLNYNRYTPFKDAAEMIKRDKKTAGKHVVYVMNSERFKQISYYSGEEVRWLVPYTKKCIDPPALTPQLCRDVLKQAVTENAAETVYVAAMAYSREPVISDSDVGAKKGIWQLFTEKYNDRRKRKVLRVYKYTASAQLENVGKGMQKK